MTRLLLTSGSGFIAVLAGGHSVTTTVRSAQEAQAIRDAHPRQSREQLDFAIVEDIAKPNAFDHESTTADKDEYIGTNEPHGISLRKRNLVLRWPCNSVIPPWS